MKAVDFYKLPRAIQDRFVGSVVSGFPPAPLLVQKVGSPLKLVWLGVSGACFLVLIIVARVGFGSLDSGLSLHSAAALPLYVGLLFGIGFGLAQAYARVVRERALPYGAGVYLFPACVIDARDDQFKVYDTQDLSTCDLQGGAVRVAFAGGHIFLFALGQGTDPQSIVADVQGARDRAMRARATDDAAELVAVDPLHNPRFSSPVGPRDPYAMKLPPWGKLGWAAAAAVGVVLGPAFWALRNSGSDKTMYARATAANDVASYRHYLEHPRGGYKPEVTDVLLPRAELKQAVATGTVEALLDYKDKHPGSKIEAEVAQAIRAAMLAELEKAKAPGTLASLEAFEKRYPSHGVGPELLAAKHAVYARELEAYKKRTPNKDKAIVPLVERLFAFAEKAGPKVEIRFRKKKSESIGRADQMIGKSPAFMGEVSYVSKYFDDKRSQKREQALAKSLSDKLDAGLSPELLDIVQGAQVGTDAEGLPEVKVPTLFVTHTVEWSGHQYTANRPRGTYVGIIFPFEATFVVPDGPKPTTFKFKTDVLKQPNLGKLREEEPMPQPGQAEDGVYEAMAQDAFEQFAGKLLALFFKSDGK